MSPGEECSQFLEGNWGSRCKVCQRVSFSSLSLCAVTFHKELTKYIPFSLFLQPLLYATGKTLNEERNRNMASVCQGFLSTKAMCVLFSPQGDVTVSMMCQNYAPRSGGGVWIQGSRVFLTHHLSGIKQLSAGLASYISPYILCDIPECPIWELVCCCTKRKSMRVNQSMSHGVDLELFSYPPDGGVTSTQSKLPPQPW